ncbi:hypothetical protein GCM10023172_05910 [Hymenobacter ginsengisoli]|uniref:Pentapeptide MXKDX repeat protein n=1 Tax=Hymenobacter ginsengisoli TaxID=1051626 RepID=A0ABP8Q0E2_9BACT|nr:MULTISPECIES: hypothetical protein [unclassified Hymenobacter]MBO2033913.1 hypothetical protein [Hymenobacter sp. BT559]
MKNTLKLAAGLVLSGLFFTAHAQTTPMKEGSKMEEKKESKMEEKKENKMMHSKMHGKMHKEKMAGEKMKAKM